MSEDTIAIADIIAIDDSSSTDTETEADEDEEVTVAN